MQVGKQEQVSEQNNVIVEIDPKTEKMLSTMHQLILFPFLFLSLRRRVKYGNVPAVTTIRANSVPNAERKSLKVGSAPAETQIKVSSARNAESRKINNQRIFFGGKLK